jgi:uncharacterized membrane protein YgcG
MRRILLALLLLSASLATPGALHARDIVIRDYSSDIVVRADGSVEVTETLRCAFEGTWNGIYRDISLQHQTGQGRREKLRLEVLSVTDAVGNPLEYWNEKPDSWTHRVKVRVPGASDAERTVVIRYRLANAVRFFFASDPSGLHDELYWNVTGNRWDFVIEHARASITLPGGVLPTAQFAYTGVEGSTASDATVSVEGGTVTAETTGQLGPREGLTLAVSWPAGTLARPSAEELRNRRNQGLWPLLLPLLALGLMGRQWWNKGRDPEKRPVVVQYEPPEGMSPAELGTLVDNSADLRDLTSTLVDLAVRGFIGIEELQEKHLFGLVSSTDWMFHRRNSSVEGLAPHEQRFIEALFAGADSAPSWSLIREAMQAANAARAAGQELDPRAWIQQQNAAASESSVRLSSLRNRFYTSLPEIRKAIYQRLIERGMYLKRPDQAKAGWAALGVVLAIGSGIGASVMADKGVEWVNPLALGIGGVLSGVLIFGFGLAMARRTEKGARAQEAALGFKEFLDKVESERYRRMITSPEMFERYLPYAMAFGVEARWAHAFEGIYREPPNWYAGSGYHTFSPSHFSSQMSSLSSQAGSTMSSSPSGSGGGGSSGGGSGGGGGGGW